jgi:hypothetical protein
MRMVFLLRFPSPTDNKENKTPKKQLTEGKDDNTRKRCRCAKKDELSNWYAINAIPILFSMFVCWFVRSWLGG